MDPTLKLILTFLLGIVSGAVLVVLLYLLLMLISIKKRSYIIEAQNKDIQEQEVLKLIDKYKENYKFSIKSDNELIKEGALKRNISCLAEDIARLFFPESKRPLAELTVDELLMLNRYIADRIEEIVDRPGLRNLKRLKLNTLIELSETKKKIEDSKAMKVAEKYQANKVLKGIMGAVNAINPVYWFKKLVVDNVINVVVNKIKLMIISISGQELYKVYSKKAFQDESLNDEELAEMGEKLAKMEQGKAK